MKTVDIYPLVEERADFRKLWGNERFSDVVVTFRIRPAAVEEAQQVQEKEAKEEEGTGAPAAGAADGQGREAVRGSGSCGSRGRRRDDAAQLNRAGAAVVVLCGPAGRRGHGYAGGAGRRHRDGARGRAG